MRSECNYTIGNAGNLCVAWPLAQHSAKSALSITHVNFNFTPDRSQTSTCAAHYTQCTIIIQIFQDITVFSMPKLPLTPNNQEFATTQNLFIHHPIDLKTTALHKHCTMKTDLVGSSFAHQSLHRLPQSFGVGLQVFAAISPRHNSSFFRSYTECIVFKLAV